jgi:hypothetical protein
MFAELPLAIPRKPELARSLMHLTFLCKEGVVENRVKSSKRPVVQFITFAAGIAQGAALIYFSKAS